MNSTTSPSTNDIEWEELYRALVRDLGLDPKRFQLLYPFTSWNWPESPPGYTSAAEHDFCAAMPQWSATGAYISSATRYNDAYGMFLSILHAYTTSPELEQAILHQQQVVQLAKNDYDTLYRQAAVDYEAATGGTNDPTFTDWLASPEGAPWAQPLDQAWAAYQEEIRILRELIAQSQTPGLETALADFQNPEHTTRYQDPHLAAFPPVPGYTPAKTPAQWLAEIAAGGGTPGTVYLRPQLQETHGYRNTWARGSLPVPYPFLEVLGAEGWRQLGALGRELAREEGEIILHLEAWDTIPIQPEAWYHPELVCRRENGPFVRGYSGYPNGEDVYLWSQGGAMNLFKAALLAAYEPTFEVVGEPEGMAIRHLREALQGVRELRVGPFVGTLEGEPELDEEGGRLRIATGTAVPMIFGVLVEILPCDLSQTP